MLQGTPKREKAHPVVRSRKALCRRFSWELFPSQRTAFLSMSRVAAGGRGQGREAPGMDMRIPGEQGPGRRAASLFTRVNKGLIVRKS